MLYLVATPIGNLGDITKRAIEVLLKVDVIACEDTRNSIKLLNAYGISKPLITYHKFNERNSSDGIIKLLKEGKDVALISDGGMPLISDPGHILVKKVREEGLGMTVLPGANAALCALVLSGIDSSRFSFIGFLPEGNKERKLLLDEIKNYQSTLLFHISPHSLQKDLNDIFLALGKRHASLAREISKVFEEVIPFVLGDRLEITEKGEFVLVIEKAEKEECKLNDLTIDEHLSFYLSEGLAKNEAIKRVSKDRNVPKNEIYIHVIKKEE